MNIKNLEIGMVINNYKQLCELLGEKVKTGKSKIIQFNNIEKLFEYEKKGHKFIITKIYNDAELKEFEMKMGRKSLYGNMVQVLIMDILIKNKGRIVTSKSKLTKSVGLVNDNYSLGYSNQKLMSNYLNIDIAYIKDFFDTSNTNISSIITTAISNLQKRGVIDVNYIKMVKVFGEVTPRPATDEERLVILRTEKECMIELGIDEIDSSNRNLKYYQFKNKRDEKLKNNTNIEYSYTGMDIIIENKFIKKEKDKLTIDIINKIKNDSSLIDLNNLFFDNVIINAEKRHINFSSSEKLLTLRFSDSYVSNFKNMANTMIRLDSPILNKAILNKFKNHILSDDFADLLPF